MHKEFDIVKTAMASLHLAKLKAQQSLSSSSRASLRGTLVSMGVKLEGGEEEIEIKQANAKEEDNGLQRDNIYDIANENDKDASVEDSNTSS